MSSPSSEFGPLNEPSRLVLIDDSEDDLRFLKRALITARGSTPIFTFARALEALQFLQSCARNAQPWTQPALVFCDLKMPEVDGFEFLRLVRSEKLSARARVIIISGCALEADVALARELGASGYLEKTPSSDILAEALRQPYFAETETRPQLFRSQERRAQAGVLVSP